MKVLVVGFPKTGTKTMNSALRILGYNVYDYMENYCHLGEEWTKILTKNGTKEDFYEMYKNVDATVDIPAVLFWEEILEAFPDCKLIFMQRRSENEWLESWENQERRVKEKPIGTALRFCSPTAYAFRIYCYHVLRVVFGASARIVGSIYLNLSSTVLKKRYRDHNTSVLARAPRTQLLEFNLSDGWEPLCKFLDKPIPDVAFPHKNKGGIILEDMVKPSPVFHQIKREMKISISILIGLIGILIYVAYKWPF